MDRDPLQPPFRDRASSPAYGPAAGAFAATEVTGGASRGLIKAERCDARCWVRSLRLAGAAVEVRSTPLEGAGRAFFGEGAGGFVEVFGEVELQWGGLHRHFALELVHVPAA